ncbi:helix-turn-helix transcriptional regulator [Microbacterium sp. CFBP 8790]|nr:MULTISPECIES: helix-turn-helix transcriptional regulator [unclassified Microbacterium]MBD8207786.1 helix-turn-helix transcriptional regulator [Microbacterium sp. CFBP 8801]MBD8510354.1 helix-turn-helix transcriptional regulator [Microbacterium sp. CFBP 8790]
MNLRRRRDTLGLTQEAVAERAGISLYAYQQYERGAATKGGAATNPRLATVLVLSQVLQQKVDELLPPTPCFLDIECQVRR